MKTLLPFFLCGFLPCLVWGQSPVTGKWKTVDDASGEPRSIVEISERSGKIYGKVVKIFPQPGEDQDPVCDHCEKDDPRYDQKIIGMEIISSLTKDGDQYTGGDILDPENGKVYRCKVWMEDNTLKVRGYIGPFYRTQTWLRVAVSK